ncbi:MAG: gamma-glutamyl-gamma-aminobutyrate hydrolase family protein [Chromatiales bacterium]|nr:gamma-glutamyl-gamma-aminobutyrate hydrolase family protein [Chromatiales bacterium]
MQVFPKAVIERFFNTRPMLGVCLGLQAMNEVFGGATVRAPFPVHGKTSPIVADTSSRLFQGIASQFSVARYHSLIIEQSAESLLRITAYTESDHIPMAAELKRKYPLVWGFSFIRNRSCANTDMK